MSLTPKDPLGSRNLKGIRAELLLSEASGGLMAKVLDLLVAASWEDLTKASMNSTNWAKKVHSCGVRSGRGAVDEGLARYVCESNRRWREAH